MDILKNKMAIKQDTGWYIQLLQWCVDHALVWTTLILGLTAIDKTFKEIRRRKEADEKKELELQELRIRKIAQEEIQKEVLTRLKDINEKVDTLTSAFFKENIRNRG